MESMHVMLNEKSQSQVKAEYEEGGKAKDIERKRQPRATEDVEMKAEYEEGSRMEHIVEVVGTPHVTVSTSSRCVRLTEDEPKSNPTPISAGQSPSSAWRVVSVSAGEKKPMVLIFCPVCEVAIRNSKKWLVQHMLKH